METIYTDNQKTIFVSNAIIDKISIDNITVTIRKELNKNNYFLCYKNLVLMDDRYIKNIVLLKNEFDKNIKQKFKNKQKAINGITEFYNKFKPNN